MKILPVILASLCGCVAASAQNASSTPASLSVADSREMRTLTGMLVQSDRSAKTRTEAAEILLVKRHPVAAKTLTDALCSATDPAAGVAVARAITNTGVTNPAFIEPLLAMLTGSDAEPRAAAAAALGVFKDPAVLARLTGLAANPDAPLPTRLAAVSAAARRVDKRTIDTLISLLAAPEPELREAAVATLAKLTGIGRFGGDEARWRAWWAVNKDKPRQQWLSDHVDSLTRQNEAQERRIDDLRTRLERALGRLYASTPVGGRPQLVLSWLQDPVAEVRLIGLTRATQRAGAGEPLAGQTRPVVRSLLTDEDPRIRAASAVLAATLNDSEAQDVLMARLKTETALEVRKALIAALGALGDGRAMDVLLNALAAEHNGAAVDAAVAVERLAARTAPTDEQVGRAVTIITEHYQAGAARRADLQRALLGLMRVLDRVEFAPLMRSALSGETATVRLEAVRGLSKLAVTDAADDIAPLTADPDRGVRQAAIAALTTLGDAKHLDIVLSRTSADVESDDVVRQRAWDAAMALLDRADNDTIAQVAADLAQRADAGQHRIDVLQMLIKRLDGDKARQIAAQIQLADALLAAGLPAEAADILGATHAAAAPDKATDIWLRWIGALLAADDAASLTYIAEQSDAKLLAASVGLLTQRLTTLETMGQYQPLIALADLAAARLAAKIPADQMETIRQLRTEAMARQLADDRVMVGKLVDTIDGGDPTLRSGAEADLLNMQRRAVTPLVELLEKALAGEKPNLKRAERIIQYLAKLAPELTGYDAEAPIEQKRKLVENWNRQLAAPKPLTTSLP